MLRRRCRSLWYFWSCFANSSQISLCFHKTMSLSSLLLPEWKYYTENKRTEGSPLKCGGGKKPKMGVKSLDNGVMLKRDLLVTLSIRNGENILSQVSWTRPVGSIHLLSRSWMNLTLKPLAALPTRRLISFRQLNSFLGLVEMKLVVVVEANSNINLLLNQSYTSTMYALNLLERLLVKYWADNRSLY